MQLRITMSVFMLEREGVPDWARLPLLADDGREILLVSQEGAQLGLPATILLAVSRSLATILDTNRVLFFLSPSVFLPVSFESLKAFKEILLFGRVEVDLDNQKENVEELFSLLDIEATISLVLTTSKAASIVNQVHTNNHCEVRDAFSVTNNADIEFVHGMDITGSNYSPPPGPSQFLNEEESIENVLESPANRLSNNIENKVEDQNQDETQEKVLRRSSRKTRLLNICKKLSERLNISSSIKRSRGVARTGLPGLRGHSVRHLTQGRGGRNER